MDDAEFVGAQDLDQDRGGFAGSDLRGCAGVVAVQWCACAIGGIGWRLT